MCHYNKLQHFLRTSGSDELFTVTTGALFAIASNIGSPNPSYNDGYTKQTAFL